MDIAQRVSLTMTHFAHVGFPPWFHPATLPEIDFEDGSRVLEADDSD